MPRWPTVLPDAALLNQAAQMLPAAKKPMIYLGDGVAYSGATDEARRVAELLGAEVYGVDFGDVTFDTTHPLWQGTTGHIFGSFSRTITQKGDVNLVMGTYLLPEVFPELGDVFAEGAKVVHIDLNAYEIAKNHPVDLALVSNPKLTLAALADALEAYRSLSFQHASEQRSQEIGGAKAARDAHERTADAAQQGQNPLHMAQFGAELAKQLPADAIVFDEALTLLLPKNWTL